MRIALISPIVERVPPIDYGGIEMVVGLICEELVRRKHKVTLYASGDSKTLANIESVCYKPLKNIDKEVYLMYVQWLTSKLLEDAKKYDVIHSHLSWHILPLVNLVKTPIVTTFHINLEDVMAKKFYRDYKKCFFTSISNSQRKPLPELNYVSTVYHGLDTEKYSFNFKPKDYILFLGRICKEKGTAEAIKIAKLAGKKLIIAAKLDSKKDLYYQKEIKPFIDNKQIKYVGPVQQKEKIKLLQGAEALIFPVQWREPFGLVMIEAMSCGTPVIAYDNGATKEIIEDGKTGYLVKNIREAAAAIKKIKSIDRENCRKRVMQHFTIEKMVDGYEEVYQKLIDKQNWKKWFKFI
ncbi:MAG: glycosyltransferase family 4 protein [Patescibacteria group bacterium]|jgi:glycosyltransferase involved in cell wall biosynthesis